MRERINIRQFGETGSERHVVLVTPEVHWNTGNIGRTCLGAGAFLHLINPLGFSLDSREVKRAGLDYWSKVQLSVWDSFGDFLAKMSPRKEELVLFSKNGTRLFWSLPACQRLFLVFGPESKGLSRKLLARYPDSIYRIPVSPQIRSLNLSTAVGIALYESLRPCSTKFNEGPL
ncbi:MAG: tRNA (cytidine(34)-2'-O)-methyltransferase [Thermodesulfobacteriota bacterium]